MNAFGLHRKRDETLALILEENARKNPAKPWISNRQIYVGSGTVLTQRTGIGGSRRSKAIVACAATGLRVVLGKPDDLGGPRDDWQPVPTHL